MRIVVWFGIVLCLLGAPTRLLAQEELGVPLSLDDARREALARDPTLVELNAELEAARQRASQARFLDPPMLEGQIWQWPISTLNPSQVDMYMVSVSQEFPGRGKRALRAAVLQTEVAAAQARVEARARELDREVRAAYLDVVTARRVLDLQRSALPLLRQAVSASEIRYESGARSQSDVLIGAVTISKLHGDLIELDATLQLALARLNTLMLREPGSPIGQLEDPPGPPVLLPVADLERLALEHHPDLAEARTMSARAIAMENEARGDLKADFRVSSGFMFRPREGDAWLASVGLTWPKAPWARGRADSRIAEARAEAGAAKARTDAVSALIKQQVRETYIRANAARQQAELLRSTILPQARQAIATASAAYQTDKADFQSVLAEQQVLLESQLGYVRAISEAAQALAELERVVGSTATGSAELSK